MIYFFIESLQKDDSPEPNDNMNAKLPGHSKDLSPFDVSEFYTKQTGSVLADLLSSISKSSANISAETTDSLNSSQADIEPFSNTQQNQPQQQFQQDSFHQQLHEKTETLSNKPKTALRSENEISVDTLSNSMKDGKRKGNKSTRLLDLGLFKGSRVSSKGSSRLSIQAWFF